MNVLDTNWCNPQQPRLSRDGTTEFLNALRDHPRIKIHQRQSWHGKTEMVNTCLADFKEPGVILQADGDEIWLPYQLGALVEFFNRWPHVMSARFFCRYFVGPNIIITSTHSYGNRPGEWHRAWRSSGRLRAKTHEPPIMIGSDGLLSSREMTRESGLVFDHYSYAFEHQLRFKQEFYGYKDAVLHWRRLQANTQWPISDLRTFLPWVDPGVTADRLFA